MEVDEIVGEYDRGRRNVHQELLFRQLKSCCGDCNGWFHGWAHMMGQRNLRGRSAMDYFSMDVPTFKSHVQACTVAMEEQDQVDRCIQTLDSTWDKEWRNPRDNRFVGRSTAERTEEYRRIYGGRYADPDYHIEG
jgi:hypothetical protein